MHPISAFPTHKKDSNCGRLRLGGIAFLLLLAFPIVVHAQVISGTTADGLKYTGSNGILSITGYTGSGGAVIIPRTLPLVQPASHPWKYLFAH